MERKYKVLKQISKGITKTTVLAKIFKISNSTITIAKKELLDEGLIDVQGTRQNQKVQLSPKGYEFLGLNAEGYKEFEPVVEKDFITSRELRRDRRMSVLAYYTFKKFIVSYIAELLNVENPTIYQDIKHLRKNGFMDDFTVTRAGYKELDNYQCDLY